MEKSQRQKQLLQAIVQEYIKEAHPVSSKILVEKYGFTCSPATIRNDMGALEQADLIAQPHTSAGRVPTEKGYQYYIKNFMERVELKPRQKDALKDAVTAVRQKSAHPQNESQGTRRLAQVISELADEAVVTISPEGEIYYTGISHIFSKPEFAEAAEMMLQMSKALDHFDEAMQEVAQLDRRHEIRVLIGDENPIARDCAMILSPFHEMDETDDTDMFGIFGPMRMNYNTNIAILAYLEQLMHNHHEHEH